MPLGAIIVMPFIGYLIQKLGAGKATFMFGILFCIVSTFPIIAPTYGLFFASLVLVGLTTGSMDIAMNAAAATAEKGHQTGIMSTCHGMWSIGGMMGAGTTSFLAVIHFPGTLHVAILSLLLIVALIFMRKQLFSIRDAVVSDKIFSLPKGPLIGLAVISFCTMMGEGAITDWSAVYLRNTLTAGAFYSGLGFAGFSLSMALGRFYGDKIIALWGARKLIIVGVLIALVGLTMSLVIQQHLVAILGFTISGLGYASLVPAIYISASRVPGKSSGESIASVASMGYFGLFIGPPLIGMIADQYGLDIGLGVVVILLLAVFLIIGRTRFY